MVVQLMNGEHYGEFCVNVNATTLSFITFIVANK
jgi:hypothetical protein